MAGLAAEADAAVDAGFATEDAGAGLAADGREAADAGFAADEGCVGGVGFAAGGDCGALRAPA